MNKWDSLSIEQKKLGVSQFINKVVIYKDKADIYLQFLPNGIAITCPIRYVKRKGNVISDKMLINDVQYDAIEGEVDNWQEVPIDWRKYWEIGALELGEVGGKTVEEIVSDMPEIKQLKATLRSMHTLDRKIKQVDDISKLDTVSMSKLLDDTVKTMT